MADRRIIVVEYPKSGGTWVTSLIGDALGWPKRDIYVDEEYVSAIPAFDVRKHPWYRGVRDFSFPPLCVIKSHELPGSSLHNFPAHVVHLVRDGRDVMVSKYIYERDFCVRNGIYEKFEISFEDYLRQEAPKWQEFVMAWLSQDGVVLVRYEDFLQDAAKTLEATLRKLGFVVESTRIADAVARNTKSRWREALAQVFTYNTFVRKGESGDWRNHFSYDHLRLFNSLAGEALHALGYV